ncbi:MAG: GntR family transcriptional regulator [Spirochaetales bacterium]|nr:GntR family transcriptional regulator [Spirochaetales bacterium]
MGDPNTTLKSQIYEKILTKIIDNEFPMDALLVESQLIKMFNVSRAPVREALIELCREEILKNIPRAGYQIVRISEKKMRDAFQLRLILEVEGLRLGFERMTDENIEELTAIAADSDRIRAEGKSSESLALKMQLNDQFHLKLTEMSGNALIHKTLGETFSLIRRGLAQIMIHEYGMPSPNTTFHTGLVQGLQERNFEKAEKNLNDDILCYKQNVWSKIF